MKMTKIWKITWSACPKSLRNSRFKYPQSPKIELGRIYGRIAGVKDDPPPGNGR